jgi:hypothetical protein
MTDCNARIAGPASQTIRNTMRQTLKLAQDGQLSMTQLQLAAGVIDDCADQVERLERMSVPEAMTRPTSADVESGRVVGLFDETRRLAIGGTLTAPPRRRGLWGRIQRLMRRF